ncbi:MAG: energy transducer TonB [Candidatus Sulfotelmatobacter sp.]|jgi:TonB family protein
MKRFLLVAVCSVCAFSGGPFAVAQNVAAQAPSSDATPQAVLTKLVPPVYPALARQARITGDVKVQVLIRKDGSVESAEVVSGHPMLKQAALESAQKSEFECRGCEGVISYSLAYTFAIGNECHNAPDCSTIIDRLPEIQQSLDHIVITVDPLCTCDPAGSITKVKVRSLKCLYLWKCGSRTEYPL